jgi:hypothetical protein
MLGIAARHIASHGARPGTTSRRSPFESVSAEDGELCCAAWCREHPETRLAPATTRTSPRMSPHRRAGDCSIPKESKTSSSGTLPLDAMQSCASMRSTTRTPKTLSSWRRCTSAGANDPAIRFVRDLDNNGCPMMVGNPYGTKHITVIAQRTAQRSHTLLRILSHCSIMATSGN